MLGLATGVAASTLAAASIRAAAADQIPVARASFTAIVDDKTFVVDYGPLGQASLGQDVLTFAGGTFTSQGCRRYGFEAAPYWLRLEGDIVHFRAEMESPDAGTIAFTGSIAGDTLDAASLWTRERWYRTVRLESWYRGRLAEPGQALPRKS
jgi:hypothetical protein